MRKNLTQVIFFFFTLCFLQCASKTVGSDKSVAFAPRSYVEKNTFSKEKTLESNANIFPTKTPLATVASFRGGSLSQSEVGGTFFFLVVNHLLIKIFAAKNVAFPAPLGGCLILFALLLLAQTVSPPLGDALFELLTPGANFLTKWMPVFFVPGLAMLPLAPSMGNSLEVLKVLSVVILGFFYTLLTTGFTVMALRKMQGAVQTSEEVSTIPTTGVQAAPAAKPFSAELVSDLTKGLILSGVATIGANRLNNKLETPLRTIFFGITAFLSFVWGARLPSDFVKIVHPLVTSTVMTLVAAKLAGFATGSSFIDVLKTYKTGSLGLMTSGAGDILLYLLGPSVVAFAIAMYSRKQVMADNLLVIASSVVVSSLGSLLGTAFFVRLIQLGGSAGTVLRRSVLPRNVTTALAIAITQMIGGDISFAAAVVVLTGIFGATYGARILDSMGINDPVTRGLGIGASAQGLGVASMANEKEAFPFAAISMVLTAVACTVLVSIPSVKEMILNIAGAA